MLTRSLSQSSRSSRDATDQHQGGMETIMETLDVPGQHDAAANDGSPIDYFTNGNGVRRTTSVRSRGTGAFDPTEGGYDADFLQSPTYSDAATSPSRNMHDSPSLSGTLHKSNSGRFSIKSAKSVRVTGSFPLGKLRVHRVDSSDSVATATPSMISSVTDEDHHGKKQCYECLRRGDVFRIIDLPDDFVVGLDSVTMTTSKSLTGFRDIPEGAHFLWVQQPGHISRSGYWFVTARMPGQIRMKQWDKYNEVLGSVVSKVEDQAERQDMESRYLEMKPYTLSESAGNNSVHQHSGQRFRWARTPPELWRTLTNTISTRYLARVTSKRHVQEFHIDTMDCVRGEFRPTSTKDLTGVSCELDFVTSQIFQDLRALNGTAHVMTDTTRNVLGLLESDADLTEDDLVAELQFTFITGTYLTNDACLEQWWNMVLKIVIRATGLVSSRPKLMKGLLQTLWAQMMFTEEYVEPEDEDDGVMMSSCCGGPKSDRAPYTYKTQMKGKLLKGLVSCKKGLAREFRRLNRAMMSPEHGELVDVWEEFVGWLKGVGWDIERLGGREEEEEGAKEDGDKDSEGEGGEDSEDEDDQPVIVDLDENGREVGTVSFHD